MRITTLSACEDMYMFESLGMTFGRKTYCNGGEDIIVVRLFAVNEAFENSEEDCQKGAYI